MVQTDPQPEGQPVGQSVGQSGGQPEGQFEGGQTMQLDLGEPVDIAGCRLWACAEFDVTIADSEGDEHALE